MPTLTTRDRYVQTADIKKVVGGRETDVLDKLGIRWREGRPHLHCPYPDHPDQHPSWRWDIGRACAMCTCSKSDTIFQVVMKLRRLDFDGAKLWIAEALGRDDLIGQKRSDKRYQRHDAASLLSPPDQMRDEELPFVYLASRLGVDPAEIPRPTTPVAGNKALEYFDPPAGSRAKPKLVGSWPCAVFGTLAVDGRRHAHRIYLSADGRAKADLGEIRPGERRNPKKSAKLADSQLSSAGCAVIWGDPDRASHIVLAEGTETGAAIAHALRDEIENNSTAVASAITAGGVEAFVPWPATESVTVAADRDEAKNGAGYQRGQKAARTFALRHHRIINVRIALPGEPDESVDWLDILLRDGPEEVRSGIENAPLFEPAPDEITEAEARSNREKRLEVVRQQYPLLPLDSVRLEYRCSQQDEIWLHRFEPDKTDRQSGERSARWIPVASPFGVLALLRKSDCDDAYGLRVAVEDMAGNPRNVDFDRAELAKLAASEIRARLFEAGLRFEAEGETICIKMLKAAKPLSCITVVSRPGWHWLPGLSVPAFVTPAGEAIGLPVGSNVELDSTVRLSSRIGCAGNFDDWYAAVLAAVLAENCAHWVLGIAAGFAGVLIDLTGLDTCGLNLSGKTSLGKTTSQRFAVSPWSSPKASDSALLRSWRATENSMELMARNASGTIFAPDEMAHADGVMVGRVLYSIAGQVGKGRMRPDSSPRRSYGWSTFVLLSGEKPLEQKVRDDGGQWTGGMAVRFPDVDVSDVNPRVPAETIDTMNNIFANYGHAGPIFVARLIESGLHRQVDMLKERVETMARTLAGEGADSARIRAALPFAVISIAGTLGREFGIIPTDADVAGAVRWGWEQFCDSSDALALDPERQAIANLQKYVKERWDVTIKSITQAGGTNNREAVGWYDDNAVYLPVQTLADAAGRGLPEKQIAGLLDRRGYLSRRTDGNRIAIRYVPKIGRIDCYALKRSTFGRTDAIVDLQAVGTDG
jgi:Domain of unknown function (DUF927)/Toprim domain